MLYQPVNVQLGLLVNTLPLQRQFAYSVLRQQPMRVAGDIARDSVKIFALTRNTERGRHPDLPLAVPDQLPVLPARHHPTRPEQRQPACSPRPGAADTRGSTGRPPSRCGTTSCTAGTRRDRCSCSALLAGIAGIFTFRRRRDPGNLALACLLITGSAVAVLLGADLYEFSWRYQLPALVTLPVAGAFGATAMARQHPRRRAGKAAGAGRRAASGRPSRSASWPSGAESEARCR